MFEVSGDGVTWLGTARHCRCRPGARTPSGSAADSWATCSTPTTPCCRRRPRRSPSTCRQRVTAPSGPAERPPRGRATGRQRARPRRRVRRRGAVRARVPAPGRPEPVHGAAGRWQPAVEGPPVRPDPRRRPRRDGVLRVRPRREAVRDGSVPAAPARPQGQHVRAGAPQLPGERAVRAVQRGVRVLLARPEHRPGDVRAEPDGVARLVDPPARLLGHRRRHARTDRARVRRGDGPPADDAGVRTRLLAVQAALLERRAAARGGPRAPAPGTAARRDRLRLLLLAADGGLPLRRGVLPGPAGHGLRARVHGRRAHGLGVAPGLARVGELPADARREPARALRGRRRRADALPGALGLLRRHQPRGTRVRVGEVPAELLRGGHPDLLAGRGRTGVRDLRPRALPPPPGPRPPGREPLPAAVRPGVLRRPGGGGAVRPRQPRPQRLGRQPALGALVWSGDISSTWEDFRRQITAGLHMGIAGIPWWTTDIGCFHGGRPDDEGFRELLVRWFQWGAFCPVMCLHGHR